VCPGRKHVCKNHGTYHDRLLTVAQIKGNWSRRYHVARCRQGSHLGNVIKAQNRRCCTKADRHSPKSAAGTLMLHLHLESVLDRGGIPGVHEKMDAMKLARLSHSAAIMVA